MASSTVSQSAQPRWIRSAANVKISPLTHGFLIAIMLLALLPIIMLIFVSKWAHQYFQMERPER